MKKNKFKVDFWNILSRDKIDIKQEIFFALSDKRYLKRLSNNAKDDVIYGMTFSQYKNFLKKNKLYNNENKEILKNKFDREKETREKKIIKTKPKKALFQALRLLNTCFTINKNVKKHAYTHYECDYCDGTGCGYCDGFGIRTSVDYDMRDSMYADKTKIIKKVINLIKNNLLPIKYGKNDDIIYFEYLGRQVSFHDPKNQIKNIKKFNGVWNEIKNKKIPFCHITKNHLTKV